MNVQAAQIMAMTCGKMIHEYLVAFLPEYARNELSSLLWHLECYLSAAVKTTDFRIGGHD